MVTESEAAAVLVVDDSADSAELVRRFLEGAGHRVTSASSVQEAVKALARDAFQLVVTDMRMPRSSGLELVRYVRENFDLTSVVVITGFPTVDNAVTAVQIGADEYLGKPFTEQEMVAAAERALRRRRRRVAERGIGRRDATATYGMMGESSAMQSVHAAVRKVAATNASALILGESGVGKELVARAIHAASSRRHAPLVPVNCGAIPQELFESELFGHVRGAFTGASSDHPGFFQASNHGTLFLDEVSELGPKLQVKLLRVLQDREVYMLGATRPRKVDVRILAASSRDLGEMQKAGTFREDLFYRLSVVTIRVPPLRERGADVLILVRYFLDRFAEDLEREPLKVTDAALEALEAYRWPGNVRELENVMHHLVVMTEGDVIDVPDLPDQMRFSIAEETGPKSGQVALHRVEIEHIRAVLDSVDGNKTKAARILGIDRKTLREKLRDG
jgi:two-component system response regulator HydG